MYPYCDYLLSTIAINATCKPVATCSAAMQSIINGHPIATYRPIAKHLAMLAN